MRDMLVNCRHRVSAKSCTFHNYGLLQSLQQIIGLKPAL